MFKFKDEGEKATIYIYGTIGEDWNEDDENRAKQFAQTLAELSPKPLDIRIDSTGGDVYEGFAIASAIQRYEGFTHAFIDGIAASAASYIALMADRVTMNDYAMLMIHNAWTIAIGNRNELRELADRLEFIDGSIARIIEARSALTLDEVTAAMDAETWFSGEDALEAGMADEVIETGQRIAASLDREIAAHFKNIPDGLAIAEAPDIEALSVPEESVPGIVGRLEPAETDASHAETSICDNEAKGAEGAFLLGNRVYWKE